jgi:hypothetical protein
MSSDPLVAIPSTGEAGAGGISGLDRDGHSGAGGRSPALVETLLVWNTACKNPAPMKFVAVARELICQPRT